MNIEKLLSSLALPLIDARSESEYEQGHIPGAINKPLLNNDERKQVGTAYKQEGKDQAVHLGYQLVGHKFSEKLKDVQNTIKGSELGVYCWRGGLRSKIFSQLLENGGYKINRLEGGYKTYRNWALDQLRLTYPIFILGGPTGSGKTEILYELEKQGEQIIDLEGLANHKGSAYGGISMPKQSSNEQMENKLALALSKLDFGKRIWVENESRLIGQIKLNDDFFEQMQLAPLLDIEVAREVRIKRILKEYAILPKDELIAATIRVKKRLGGLNTKLAIAHIKNDEFKEWIDIMLTYYDKGYAHGKKAIKKDRLKLNLSGIDAKENATLILKYLKENV